MKSNSRLIVLAVTAVESTAFLRGQISFLRNLGYRVALVCSAPPEDKEGADFYRIEMRRGISPYQDLICLLRIWLLLIRLKPVIVNAGTPKAGLLFGIAAWIARVPNRVYTCHGLRLETLKGLRRILLWISEWVSIKCSHVVFCVSQSLRAKLEEHQLCSANKTEVILKGSCNGVDVDRFVNSGATLTAEETRRRLGIPSRGIVVGFVGRIVRDKGVDLLVQAFLNVAQNHPAAYLLLCGDYEDADPITSITKQIIESHSNIVVTGFVSDVREYYRAMDFVVLPTYREGLPTVILEASAMGKSVIATAVTGCVDAIVHKETGILVPPGDGDALIASINYLVENPNRAKVMGIRGRTWVSENFSNKDVWQWYSERYARMLS